MKPSTSMCGVRVGIFINHPVSPTDGQVKRLMRLKYFSSYEISGAAGFVFVAYYRTPLAALRGTPVLRKKICRVLSIGSDLNGD